MNRYAIVIMLLFCILCVTVTRAERSTDSHLGKEMPTVKIDITKIGVTENSLELQYQIRNDSENDAWILAGTQITEDSENAGMNADVFMAEDGRTLMIRRRLSLPILIAGPPFYGRYVRIEPGESQTEWVFIKLPVHPLSQFECVMRQEKGLEYATRLAIEIGYYPGNLPEMIFSMFGETPKYSESPTASRGLPVKASSLNSWNERLISRDEEFLIPYDRQTYKGEQFSGTTINDVQIPYVEGQDTSGSFEAPDLASCSKVEIQYEPSMLEYYFPYASQQSLLSPEEMEYLRSKKTLVVEGAQELKAIATDVAKAAAIGKGYDRYILGALVRYRSKVDVVCFCNNKPSSSFSVYKDNTIVREGNRGECYEGFPSLTMLTQGMPALNLRTKCAANLKNLWYRFRFFHRTEATRSKDSPIKGETVYPVPTEWCDSMLRPFYPTVEGFPLPVVSKMDEKIHICPSAGEGKNHYAMNPDCKPDSPPDMVLLFETKAGWNQHGGPELFTLDNHDPKGGCVLLNDGTVKFIRTTEELQQLRWK